MKPKLYKLALTKTTTEPQVKIMLPQGSKTVLPNHYLRNAQGQSVSVYELTDGLYEIESGHDTQHWLLVDEGYATTLAEPVARRMAGV